MRGSLGVAGSVCSVCSEQASLSPGANEQFDTPNLPKKLPYDDGAWHSIGQYVYQMRLEVGKVDFTLVVLDAAEKFGRARVILLNSSWRGIMLIS